LHGPARAAGEPRVEIITDHSALTQVTMEKSPQLARWKAALEEFSYKITHRARVKMAFVDYFSRSPHAPQGKWRDSTFNDTLNHATDYLQSEKRFMGRSGASSGDGRSRLGGGDCRVGRRQPLDRHSAGGQRRADRPDGLGRYAGRGVRAGDGQRYLGGGGRGQGIYQNPRHSSGVSAFLRRQRRTGVSVGGACAEFGNERRPTRPPHPVRGIPGCHGISRIGGARPYICCDGRRIATLRSTHADGKPAVAAATRSSAPLAGPAQRSGEDFKKGALPGIVEFKEA
jgi:hypothetical protein